MTTLQKRTDPSMLAYSHRARFLLDQRYEPDVTPSVTSSLTSEKRKLRNADWRIRWLRHHVTMHEPESTERIRRRYNTMPRLNHPGGLDRPRWGMQRPRGRLTQSDDLFRKTKSFLLTEISPSETETEDDEPEDLKPRMDKRKSKFKVPLRSEDVIGIRRMPRNFKPRKRSPGSSASSTDESDLLFLDDDGKVSDSKGNVLQRENTDEDLKEWEEKVQSHSVDERTKVYWQSRRKMLQNTKKKKKNKKKKNTKPLSAIKERNSASTSRSSPSDMGYASNVDISKEYDERKGRHRLVVRVYKNEDECLRDKLERKVEPPLVESLSERTMKKVESRLPDGLNTRLIIPQLRKR